MKIKTFISKHFETIYTFICILLLFLTVIIISKSNINLDPLKSHLTAIRRLFWKLPEDYVPIINFIKTLI